MDPCDVGQAWRALGRELAELRKAAGYTQHSFAPMTLYGRSTIANVETGHQHPDRTFWLRCDEVLETGGVLAAGYDRVTALERHYRRYRSVTAPALPAALADADNSLVVRYDELVAHGCLPPRKVVPPERSGYPACGPGSAAGTQSIDGHGGTTDDASIVTVVIQGRSHHLRLSRRALFEAVSGSLVMPLFEGGASPTPEDVDVDPGIVDHFAALRAVLVESDNLLGAAAILPTARQQLGQIAQFRRAARGGLRDELLRTEARWAEFAGWLSDDLGDRAAGDWWLGQALTMAQEVEDAEFTMYVFARMAQRAAEATDRDRVLGLAHAAGRSGCDRAQVRAFAALQRAHGHSIAGDIAEFQLAVDDARELVTPAAVTAGELGSFCTTPYVWAQEGEGWLRLGRPHTAVERFDRALATWPESFRRDRGLYMARTAAAHAAAGDQQQAAVTAMTALELADVTRSVRIRREVVSVGRQLTKFRTEPGVDDLFAALESLGQTS